MDASFGREGILSSVYALVPKQFTVLEELPTLANGKLDNQALRARTA